MFDAINLKSVNFYCTYSVITSHCYIICERGTINKMIHILLLLVIVIILQVLMRHFLNKIELESKYKNIITYIPFGLGLFFTQNVYYERQYPHWEIPLKEKLNLKYIYLLTFLEFVAIYICLFVMKN